MMNLTQLKYFHTVCTFHSISNAAEYLHIAQPSLSAAIKELENEFGVTLFVRHHKGVTLTEEGEILCNMSGDILQRVQNAQSVMEDLGKGRKTLKLGIPPMIGSLVLSDIYTGFLSQNPDISIEISEGGYHDLMQKLSDNYLDIVFLPHDNSFSSDFSAVPLAKREIVCCVHKDNPLAALPHIDAHTLKNTPLVLFENSFFQTTKIKKWFDEQGVRPHILLQTEQLSTATKVISENLAAGFMFKHTVNHPNMVYVPLHNPLQLTVSLVCKKAVHSSRIMKQFITFMQHCNAFADET